MKTTFRILFCVYVAVVLYLCFANFGNDSSVPASFLGLPADKVVHFLMFIPFPVLAFLAFDRFTESVKSTILFVGATFFVGVFMSIATEWGQAHFTDYRVGDPMDVVADTAGLLLGSVLAAYLDIRKQCLRGGK